MTQPTDVQRVGVLGAGTIGASWTAWFLACGFSVDVWDPRPEAEAYVQRTITEAWPAMARLGMVASAVPDAWRFVATPEAAVEAADFVQENAPERLPIKRELYARIDAALPPDTILGVQYLGSDHVGDSGWLRHGQAVRGGPSVQSATFDSIGRGGRRLCNFRGDHRVVFGVLPVHWQAANSYP